MTIGRSFLDFSNFILNVFGLKVDTLSEENKKKACINEKVKNINFHEPIYCLNLDFEKKDFNFYIDMVKKNIDGIVKVKKGTQNFGFDPDNLFYRTPDLDVLYSFIGFFKPKKIIETGCGNSTRIILNSIRDFGLDTQITCVDPNPRKDIEGIVSKFFKTPIEFSAIKKEISLLEPNDIFFIDTSHEISPGNDCSYIYGVLLPIVKPGVIVHIHDIYLPYEYPEIVLSGYGKSYGEQLALANILQFSDSWEVIFPTYYLVKNKLLQIPQEEKDGFKTSSSFWMRRK